MGSQPVLAQPVTNRRLTEADPLCDLPGGQPLLDQRGERVAVDPTLWRVPIPIQGGEPVPLDPVADRRGMPTRQPADGLKREPPPQICLQNPRFHHANTSSRTGRNQASSAVPASRSAPPDAFSIASVFDSIWRTRSRVTPTSWPMSSRVIGPLSPRP